MVRASHPALAKAQAPPGRAGLSHPPYPLSLECSFAHSRRPAPKRIGRYTLVAIKGRPHDGSLKYFTQIHMKMEPHPKVGGYFGSYYMPSNKTSMFWSEGTFLGSWDVVWSYYHSHSTWLKEMLFYVGANSTELQMAQTGVGVEVTEGMSPDQVAVARQHLSERAQAVGAQLVCHFQRDISQLEVRVHRVLRMPHGMSPSNVATPVRVLMLHVVCVRVRARSQVYPGEHFSADQVADRFYRKSAGCVPFAIAHGMPYVAMVITSPDTVAAAMAKEDPYRPDENLAILHTVIRLFVHSDSHPWPSCNVDCGYAPQFFVE